MQDGLVLVAGATGYVGGRLVPLLLGKGYRVRVLARDERKVRSRPWGRHTELEIVRGDVRDTDSLRAAVRGCRAVYYLVHSMEASHKDFCDADRRAAYCMLRALKGSEVRRLIYLSGLLPDDPHLSAHLRSRGEVEEIFSLGDVPLTTLRAAQLIGSGSASFEMIRWLVDRLPLMITPRWTHVRTQPIAVTDALAYLAGVLEREDSAGQGYDIGGPDILSYADLFRLYAEAAGLRKRLLIPFPLLSIGASARLISLMTPIPGALARPLIEGMRNEVICQENRIRELIPLELTPIRTAVRLALGTTREQQVSSSWSDAGLPRVPQWVMRGGTRLTDGTAGTAARNAESVAAGNEGSLGTGTAAGDEGNFRGGTAAGDERNLRGGTAAGNEGSLGGGTAAGNEGSFGGGTAAGSGTGSVAEWVMRGDADYAGAAIYNDAYSIRIAAGLEEVWRPVVRIGGAGGWYSGAWLWKLRGFMDRLVGGPGVQRGRRSEEELYIGDGLDFWRVLDIRPRQRLLLFTEMRLPGEGLLDLRLRPCRHPGKKEQGSAGPATELAICLYFRPRGLPGMAYWYAVSPFHRIVFMGMLRNIAKGLGKPVLQGPKRIRAPYVPPSDDD